LTVLARLLISLLALTHCCVQPACADATIRVRVVDGTPRAEFMLNPEYRCVLEDDIIVCTRVSK
jgi:hypothetical protein